MEYVAFREYLNYMNKLENVSTKKKSMQLV